MTSIRIGTRGSKLALWQAEWVAGQLQQRGHDVELVIVSTQGDTSTASLTQVGGQGVFTKEIQNALLQESVDIAVHSLKDLPTIAVPGLTIGAIPERESTADCLISRQVESFENLPSGARVGTGSARRASQLRAWRPDVVITDIRGNVDSRLRKLEEGIYDAIVLAMAGLNRLKLSSRATETLPEERMLPAIGQGALGLECRREDARTLDAIKPLNHEVSAAAVTAERVFLGTLLAGCLAPVAAIGRAARDGNLVLRGRVLALDGSRCVEGQVTGPVSSAEQLGSQLAEQLKQDGAEELIRQARDS
ncbi:MAG: hydroxymethylbilane synthase [Planctomycetales bacterium]|nr:hydroxymethylbilane synthase [Planctomycetales bacterium]